MKKFLPFDTAVAAGILAFIAILLTAVFPRLTPPHEQGRIVSDAFVSFSGEQRREISPFVWLTGSSLDPLVSFVEVENRTGRPMLLRGRFEHIRYNPRSFFDLILVRATLEPEHPAAFRTDEPSWFELPLRMFPEQTFRLDPGQRARARIEFLVPGSAPWIGAWAQADLVLETSFLREE